MSDIVVDAPPGRAVHLRRPGPGGGPVADTPDRWAAHGVLVLHDRRHPRTRATVGHVAVAASGVYVIDAQRDRGRPGLRVHGGVLHPRATTLVVGGRDSARLVDGVHRQVDLVRAALAATHPDVPVRGMLCLVDADWPSAGGAFTVDDVDVVWPGRAAQVLGGEGPLTSEQVAAVHAALADAFPVG